MLAPAMKFDFVLLYVSDPLRSARFYTKLLNEPPIEATPTFAMVKLSADVMLGLWLRGDVAPPVAALPGGSEIAFTVETTEHVTLLHAKWSELEIAIAQPPTEMDFGHTFVALDPDGNRIRVFCPALR
jgi:catechol 2,3-dioxygenase-like lactoylglutathione lyase family enzyme